MLEKARTVREMTKNNDKNINKESEKREKGFNIAFDFVICRESGSGLNTEQHF